MLIPFIVAALCLTVEDIFELKKIDDRKGIFIYVAFILASIALCFWFTASDNNHSLSDMIMGFFNIQG